MCKSIRSLIETREIKSLYHFTRVDNLKSILDNGLLTINSLKTKAINFYHNDDYRYEGIDSVCLSISFPNYKMFYKYRCNCDDKWCVIELKPSILYKKDCLFCIKNAASNEETTRDNEEKKGIDGLKKLFYDDNIRKECNLPKCYTTNPQAEVLVLEDIDKYYIRAIHFDTKKVKVNFKFANYPNIKFRFTLGLFSPRTDYSVWQ